MAERIAATGYVAIKKESTKGTAVTPNVYVPYYEQSMTTAFNVIEDTPIIGNKFKRWQTVQGVRSHTGSITIMAEPNSAGYFMDMLATKASTSGSDPYTHTFSASAATNPNSYTMDISVGSQVIRFFGVEASKMSVSFDGDLMKLTFELSALGSFYGREITSISTTTVNFKTEYDASATTGLVASDLIYVVDPEGAIANLSTTISSITDADTVVIGSSAAAFATGDMLVLRPATPSYTLLTPFTWPRTQFCFGTSASVALSATQTRLDSGTEFSLMHDFNDNEGEKRSGGFDPASLIRMQYDFEYKIKKYFDIPDEIRSWNALTKRACVMRAYTGSTNQYELRITMNNMKARTNDMPTAQEDPIYYEVDYAPNYDTSDTQGFDIKVLNSASSI